MARKLLMGDDRRPIRRALSIGQARQPAWVQRAMELTREWDRKHGRVWISCERIAQEIQAQLQAEGFPVAYAIGVASFYDVCPDEGPPGTVESEHAWLQQGRQVFDPKSYILRRRRLSHWRYWNYSADALTVGDDSI